MAPLAPRPATLGWLVLTGLIAVLLAAGAGWSVATWSLSGVTGPAGAAGPEGSAGPTGTTGPQGTQGSTGRSGAVGAPGTTGAAGPTGPAGPTGAQGARGATGSVGAPGAVGATGATGARGASGPAGPDGERGPRGATGAQGPDGPAGAAGPAGEGAVIVRVALPGDESTVTTGPLAEGEWLLTAAATIKSHADNPYLSCYFDVTVDGSATRSEYVTDHVFRDRVAGYTGSMRITVAAGATVSVYSGCAPADAPGDIEALALTTSATMVGSAP